MPGGKKPKRPKTLRSVWSITQAPWDVLERALTQAINNGPEFAVNWLNRQLGTNYTFDQVQTTFNDLRQLRQDIWEIGGEPAGLLDTLEDYRERVNLRLERQQRAEDRFETQYTGYQTGEQIRARRRAREEAARRREGQAPSQRRRTDQPDRRPSRSETRIEVERRDNRARRRRQQEADMPRGQIRTRYRRRKFIKYKKKRGYKQPRLKYGASIPRPLNGISNYRKVVLRQRVPLVLCQTGTSSVWSNSRKGQLSENGILKSPLQFRVSVQPFTTVGITGTENMYHACSMLRDTAGTAIMGVDFQQAEYYSDVIEACKRYGSMRIGGMRVELKLLPTAIGSNGTAYTWSENYVQLLISCGFDPYDNAPNDSSATANLTARAEESLVGAVSNTATYPPAIDTATLRRLSYFKEHSFTPSNVGLGGRATGLKRVLFSRTFPASKGPETRAPFQYGGVGVVSGVQSVKPGQWDHRATYDPNYANAFEAAQSSINRMGALYVDIRPNTAITGDAQANEFWNWTAGASLEIGCVETTHVIYLMNDLDSLGRSRVV